MVTNCQIKGIRKKARSYEGGCGLKLYNHAITVYVDRKLLAKIYISVRYLDYFYYSTMANSRDQD